MELAGKKITAMGGGPVVGALVGVASCLHSISLMNECILAKLIQIYHSVGEKC